MTLPTGYTGYSYNSTITDGTNTATLSLSRSQYIYASSTWQELFLITPQRMDQVGTTGTMTVNLTLAGSLTGNGYFGYSLTNFQGDTGLNAYPGYVYTYSPSAYTQSSGVTVPTDGTPFSEALGQSFNVTLGDPYLLTSSLYTTVSDGSSVDIDHTVKVTGITIPSGTEITFLSGAPANAYGILSGGNGYGRYGTGGQSPVSAPGAMWLLGPGLACLVMLRKRISSTGLPFFVNDASL
jgi:hypothetical protein